MKHKLQIPHLQIPHFKSSISKVVYLWYCRQEEDNQHVLKLN